MTLFKSKRLGTKYGGWARLPIHKFNSETIIYSFGAGEDISYEFILSGLIDSRIYIFDPTPRAEQHFKDCIKILTKHDVGEYNKRFGGGDKEYNKYILNSDANLNKIFFLPYGLYDEDTKINFFYPTESEHVSLSIDNLQNTNKYIELEVKKIDTLCRINNHDYIDVIKMNIEGAEVRSLQYMLDNTDLKPKYISVKYELLRDKNNAQTQLMMNRLIDTLDKFYNVHYKNTRQYNYTYVLKTNL